MNRRRIFISSVQKEFADERIALRDYLQQDPLLRRFFDAFLFEDLPAADRRAEEVYLDEVADCDIYLGLFGDEYGWEDEEGLSPTEREFNEAAKQSKPRLIYVKGADDESKSPKVQALIRRAGAELIRRRFNDLTSLKPAVYASLVDYLEEQQLIAVGPFDAAPCQRAKLDDLNEKAMTAFIRQARHARGFPLAESTSSVDLLTHLNLLDDWRPANAAVLLFGIEPAAFFAFV